MHTAAVHPQATMEMKTSVQPSPHTARQNSAPILDTEAGTRRNSSLGSDGEVPAAECKKGPVGRAASGVASIWLAGFAAASTVIPSLMHWRSALRLGMGLFLFSMLQAYVHSGGSDASSGIYIYVVPAYFVSVLWYYADHPVSCHVHLYFHATTLCTTYSACDDQPSWQICDAHILHFPALSWLSDGVYNFRGLMRTKPTIVKLNRHFLLQKSRK